ncbi:MAG TPA: thioesterase family protein [Pyrinomonadaceae bacterium]|jgi:acyl-CoA thioester hydrolase|nr:thioesterase family protein [Pyrinomonadaceae bacterium]
MQVFDNEFTDEAAAWDETHVRVRYAETDKMGVVYHANYLVWFEIGRTEYCRARGFSYRDMEELDNAYLVVVESYCRYKAPAYYDDELIVRTRVTEMRKRSLRFGYEICRADNEKILAEGETTHVVTDVENHVRSFPDNYREMLLSPPVESFAQSATSKIPEDLPPS